MLFTQYQIQLLNAFSFIAQSMNSVLYLQTDDGDISKWKRSIWRSTL